MTGPSYAAVIPTRDRPELLRKCLESLATQTARPQEVIVVDDGSRNAVDTGIGHGLGLDLTVQRLASSRGQSAARNLGANIASAPIVMFVDDDNCLDSECARELVHFIDAKTCSIALQLVRGDNGIWQAEWGWMLANPRIVAGLCFLRAKGGRMQETPVLAPHPSNLYAVSRDVFLAVGGFDVQNHSRFLEDVDLGIRLGKSGIRCIVTPSGVTRHEVHGGADLPRQQGTWEARGRLTRVSLSNFEFLPSCVLSTVLALREGSLYRRNMKGASIFAESRAFFNGWLRAQRTESVDG